MSEKFKIGHNELFNAKGQVKPDLLAENAKEGNALLIDKIIYPKGNLITPYFPKDEDDPREDQIIKSIYVNTEVFLSLCKKAYEAGEDSDYAYNFANDKVCIPDIDFLYNSIYEIFASGWHNMSEYGYDGVFLPSRFTGGLAANITDNDIIIDYPDWEYTTLKANTVYLAIGANYSSQGKFVEVKNNENFLALIAKYFNVPEEGYFVQEYLDKDNVECIYSFNKPFADPEYIAAWKPVAGGSADGITYLTEAPTKDNTKGLIFVVLDEEPETKYNGYIYIILAS